MEPSGDDSARLRRVAAPDRRDRGNLHVELGDGATTPAVSQGGLTLPQSLQLMAESSNARTPESQIPESAQVLSPEQIPNARQIPEANARQIPESDDDDLSGFWNQIPETADFDQPDLERAELWRLEKDGNYCRWRLRFTKERCSRPGGQITDAIAQILADRPGKGRHAEGREDSERLRREAEHYANRLRTSTRGRPAGTKPKQGRKDADRFTRRRQMPELQRVENGELPDVPKYIN